MGKLIGTAGHVDHGKTSLIAALTGIDADRLPEEKRRGMTIDLGFAHLESPNHGTVSIVDVPGHERFVTNMLVGAQGIDVALLCVAADESVMPQTIEHFRILELLPVEQMVVALTRADLADDDMRQIAIQEVNALLEGTRFAGAPIVPVSVVSQEGLSALRDALEQALDAHFAERPGHWYLPIDRAFVPKGQGVVVTGTLMAGHIEVGSQAMLYPNQIPVKVRSIECHSEGADQAEFGMRTAVRLGGATLSEVHRGMILCEEGTAAATRCIDVDLRWLVPVPTRTRVRVAIGAEDAIGRVLVPNEDAQHCQILFESEIAAVVGQPVIVRRYSPPTLLAGGVVTIAAGIPRKSKSAPILAQQGTDEEKVLTLLEQSAKAVPTEEICRVLGKPPQAIGTLLENLLKSEAVMSFAGAWLLTTKVEPSLQALVSFLGNFHEHSPTLPGCPRGDIEKGFALGLEGKSLARFLTLAQERQLVRLDGNLVALAEFRMQLSAKQEQLLQRLESEIEKFGFQPPALDSLAQAVGAPKQALQEIVKLGINAGRLVRLEGDIIYTNAVMDRLKQALTQFTEPFAASEFRDATQTSRKYVIPILEHFDAKGLTMRMGDKRVVRGQSGR